VSENDLLWAFFNTGHASNALVGVNIISTFFVYFYRTYRANFGASATVGTGFNLKDAWGRKLRYYGQASFFGIVDPKFSQATGHKAGFAARALGTIGMKVNSHVYPLHLKV